MDDLIATLSISANPPVKQEIVKDLITLENLFSFWNKNIESPKIRNELKDFLDELNFFQNFSESTFYKGKDQEQREFLLIGPEIIIELEDFFLTNFDQVLPKVIYPFKYDSVVSLKIETPERLEQIKAGLRKNNFKVSRRLEALEKAKRSLELAKEIVAGRRPNPIPCSDPKQLALLKQPQGETIYLFAVDVESFEKNHDVILELGWIIFDVLNQRFYNRHIIIKEYQHVRNYKFVPDYKDKFMFGKSEYLSETEAKLVLQNEIDTLSPNLAMICHGLSSELKYFQKMGLKLRHSYEFDTNELHQSIFTEHGKSISLVNLLNKYNIKSQFLHNAGNDAHYTLLAFLAMCGYSLPQSNCSKDQKSEDGVLPSP